MTHKISGKEGGLINFSVCGSDEKRVKVIIYLIERMMNTILKQGHFTAMISPTSYVLHCFFVLINIII